LTGPVAIGSGKEINFEIDFSTWYNNENKVQVRAEFSYYGAGGLKAIVASGIWNGVSPLSSLNIFPSANAITGELILKRLVEE
jgi:hypothetical protein